MSEFAIVDLGSAQYCCKKIVLELKKKCVHKVEGKAVTKCVYAACYHCPIHLYVPLGHTVHVPPKLSKLVLYKTDKNQ